MPHLDFFDASQDKDVLLVLVGDDAELDITPARLHLGQQLLQGKLLGIQSRSKWHLSKKYIVHQILVLEQQMAGLRCFVPILLVSCPPRIGEDSNSTHACHHSHKYVGCTAQVDILGYAAEQFC
jgi:hypothetical protein